MLEFKLQDSLPFSLLLFLSISLLFVLCCLFILDCPKSALVRRRRKARKKEASRKKISESVRRVMEEPPRVSFRNGRLASRKAEEAAQRRFQAATWLEKMAGPLGLSLHPSEQEFISCLKSGLVLCNAINKIQPGAVPKVVTNQPLGLAYENQTLPAFQYFENIRNFLVAADELKIPSFEASDFERDTMEAGSVGKIVDCILGLKAYHEWKQFNKVNVPWKQVKSPLVSHKIQLNIPTLSSSAKCLNMSGSFEKLQPMEIDDQRIEGKVDSLVQTIADSLFGSKENIDHNVFHFQHQETVDPMKLFNRIISSSLQEHKLRLVEDYMVEGNKTMEVCNSSSAFKNCSYSFGKELCNRWKLLGSQETELGEIKALLTKIKLDCAELQSQVQNDLTQIGNQVERLSVAAVGYHRAIEENKNLHNMLQELKGNIRVFCRIRPSFVAGAKSSIDYIGNDGTLILLDPLKSQNARKVFQFNKVFGPNATQEEVYKETQSLIRSVMDGYNVCIFAYGQTGSGKTYSMCGPEIGSDKDVGINSKALNDLFQISCTRKDIKYEIHVQMVEIYNEQVRDLLSEEATTTKLEIRNCSSNGGLSLPDATMHFVQSTYDVINLMKVGEKNRAFSCTAMNNRSSRSHSVLTVHVRGRDVLGNTLQSSLHLIDLAGSERVDKSEVTGDRLKEAVHINKSLSCLGDVIAALAQKSSHIPYRNSKLTLLLQNSLGGHAKMLMLTHVSPEAESYNETISTLKFAQRVSTVELGAAHVNKESREIRDLWEQIDSLKRELATREREKSLHKIKENSSTSERSKQNEPTPPHQLLIKTPLPRPKINTEHSVTRLRRLSLEGSVHGKSQHQTKNSNSDQQHSQIEGQLKDVYREEINAKEAIETCSAMPNLPSASQLTNLGRTCGQLDEVSTPGADQIKLSSNTSSTSKGSHIRKSLQTISKLINGSDKRHYQATSVVMPLKQEKNLVSTKNSPSTLESRYKRRQSLTNVNSNETKESRRSSLGGKLVESYPRTPLAFSASTMSSAKRWL